MAAREPGVFINPAARRRRQPLEGLISKIDPAEIASFHRKLPDYAETSLRSMPDVARELGVGHVLVKDEGTRFGLTSFKILGASWAVYRAVAAHVGLLSSNVSLDELGAAARVRDTRLITCTDGNWGRACARMANLLGIKARILVPWTMDDATQTRIRSEGAEVRQLQLDYDASVKAAEQESRETGALFVADTAWPGYEEIPTWVVHGYSTLLSETDRQVKEMAGKQADLAIGSAGVGSFMQAVTMHYRTKEDHDAVVVAVEPVVATCVRTSLEAGEIVPIKTGETIMDGMNCGTPSSIAWPILQHGLDACVSVTDQESHNALLTMRQAGVKAGPCGAAPLAALRQLKQASPSWLKSDTVVVLFCTEGERPYKVPT